MKILDISYRSSNKLESIFSNLYPRTFRYKGRDYRSVEHAYQTLKSGEFDSKAYNRNNLKPIGVKPVNKAISFSLMEELIYENLIQNPEMIDILKQENWLEDYKILHRIDKGFWRENFPKALISAINQIKNERIENG